MHALFSSPDNRRIAPTASGSERRAPELQNTRFFSSEELSRAMM